MRFPMIVVAGFCFAITAHAQGGGDIHPNQIAPQATTDSLKQIYFVGGVYNSGAANAGIATTCACSSFSNVPETIKYVIRDASGTVVVNTDITVPRRGTMIASTHATNMSGEFILHAPTGVQGSAVIASTTTKLFCSALCKLLDEDRHSQWIV